MHYNLVFGFTWPCICAHLNCAYTLLATHGDNIIVLAVNVVITALGADYTGLGSFGSVDNFGENLVILDTHLQSDS